MFLGVRNDLPDGIAHFDQASVRPAGKRAAKKVESVTDTVEALHYNEKVLLEYQREIKKEVWTFFDSNLDKGLVSNVNIAVQYADHHQEFFETLAKFWQKGDAGFDQIDMSEHRFERS